MKIGNELKEARTSSSLRLPPDAAEYVFVTEHFCVMLKYVLSFLRQATSCFRFSKFLTAGITPRASGGSVPRAIPDGTPQPAARPGAEAMPGQSVRRRQRRDAGFCCSFHVVVQQFIFVMDGNASRMSSPSFNESLSQAS